MTELFIPPKEMFFRLRGYVSNYFLYSRHEQEPTFGHTPGPVYPDQWWQLIPGTGKFAGYYQIQSKFTGKVIFSRNSPVKLIGHVVGDGNYEDNWFKIEPGTGKLAGYFRLRNYQTDRVLFSRLQPEPELNDYPGHLKSGDDNYFTFILEDLEMEITRVEYHLDKAMVTDSVSEVIGSTTLRNRGAVSQVAEFEFTRDETNSSSFEYTHGYPIRVGTSGKVAIPFVESGQVKVDGTKSQTLKWGTAITETKPYSIRLPAVGPFDNKITVTAFVSRSNIEVPFTVYSRSVAKGFEVATHGIYKGVTHWNVRTDVKQERA
ncbi:hypothetical protein MPTK2_4g90470P [Marchantia polymorpha subsp. ruderalis]